MSDVAVQELELETAELLPNRETLHAARGGGGQAQRQHVRGRQHRLLAACLAQAPAAQREGSAQRAGRPPALRGRPPIPNPRVGM